MNSDSNSQTSVFQAPYEGVIGIGMSTESGMVLVPRNLVECVANILEIEKYSVDGCMIRGLREALAAAPASPLTPAVELLQEALDILARADDSLIMGDHPFFERARALLRKTR